MCFSYNQESIPFIIENVSLKVKKGQCVSILGRVGSGKTTLLDLIAGQLSPSKGSFALE